MLKGPLLALLAMSLATASLAEGALDRARRALPPADRVTLDRERAQALACSTRRAETQARITGRSASEIADEAWSSCKDAWATVALTFGQIREERGESGPGLDDSLTDFGRAADLLRRDWTTAAGRIIAEARRTGPPL